MINLVENKRDFWGDINAINEPISPLQLLQEQSVILKEKTNGKLYGKLLVKEMPVHETKALWNYNIPFQYIQFLVFGPKTLSKLGAELFHLFIPKSEKEYPLILVFNDEYHTLRDYYEFEIMMEKVLKSQMMKRRLQKYLSME